MARRRMATLGLLGIAFGAGYLFGAQREVPLIATAEASTGVPAQPMQVFELRTYTAPAGRLDDLLARFRNHTVRIFTKHGMTSVGYWLPQDDPLARNTLIYLLAHPSREAAEANWRTFSADPEWQAVAEESQRDGRLIAGLQRVYLDPTDFSPMR